MNSLEQTAQIHVDRAIDIALSVVIVSYKNYGILTSCLDSIQEFNDIGDALEVIVVEQSPEDSLYERLCWGYPWVVVERHENRGFGAGNNAGAALARGRYLLFLNPDTVLLEPVFRFSIARFEENPKLGLFGVRLVDSDGNRNQSFYFRKPYGILRGSVLWRICNRFDWFIPSAMYITGADMFVRADAFQKVGFFDERMFMYFEETYLCEKLERLGMSIGYFADKRIVHLEGKTGGDAAKFRRQLDSLEVLCGDLDYDFRKVLRNMVLDRKIKAMLGSDKETRQREIREIEMWLSRGGED